MLFAPSAKLATATLQDKLTSLQHQQQKHTKHHHHHQHHQQQQQQKRHDIRVEVVAAVAAAAAVAKGHSGNNNPSNINASDKKPGNSTTSTTTTTTTQISSSSSTNDRSTSSSLTNGMLRSELKGEFSSVAVVRPKPEDIVEAMKKLDAKLVAYLAGDVVDMPSPKQLVTSSVIVQENVLEMMSDDDHRNDAIMHGNDRHRAGIIDDKDRFREEQLKIFKSITSVKLQMEALTLQPEGTKRMELLQSEIRPIFSVECQLSHELIRHVERFDMFHIMQFESEKFHSLTQCTRFGQEAERRVCLSSSASSSTGRSFTTNAKYAEAQARFEAEEKLLLSEQRRDDGGSLIANDSETPNLGRIHFTVWWREPGTCLNEMLGMGVLELNDLYKSSLLEQCKCIAINRRGVHLASLYFKISLQLKRNNNPLLLASMLTIDDMNAVAEPLNGNGCDAGEKDSKTADNKSNPKNINNNNNNNNNNINNNNTNNNNNDNSKGFSIGKSINTDSSAANNGDGFQLETSSNFSAETSKVRLLKGFIYAGDTKSCDFFNNCDYYLISRRFWYDEAFATLAADPSTDIQDGGDNGPSISFARQRNFNYQEQFAVINDEQFLKRVFKQYMQLEVWRRMKSSSSGNENANKDGNGNNAESESSAADVMHPVGVIRLPLHQFFIAYRDEAITSHLCKGKMPVMSIDSWAAIIDHRSGTSYGEVKCLLAIGSEEQIANLKQQRDFPTPAAPLIGDSEIRSVLKQPPLDCSSGVAGLAGFQISKPPPNDKKESTAKGTASAASTSNIGPLNNARKATNMGVARDTKTAELLSLLKKALFRSGPPAYVLAEQRSEPPQSKPQPHPGVSSSPSSSSSSLLSQLTASIGSSFRFMLNIKRASGLPLNPPARYKKNFKRYGGSKAMMRYPPNEPPAAYVTFQADEDGNGKLYKSHEGPVYATCVAKKSQEPQWQQRFRIAVSIDYLVKPKMRFILKILKKADPTSDTAAYTKDPTPMEDAIIGFASLDLSTLVHGANITRWYNIVNFNGRITGQLLVNCSSLLDLQKILKPPPICPAHVLFNDSLNADREPSGVAKDGGEVSPTALTITTSPTIAEASANDVTDTGDISASSLCDEAFAKLEDSMGCRQLNLSESVVKKYIELEGIAKRLRTRLADVTGEELSRKFDYAKLAEWEAANSDDKSDEFLSCDEVGGDGDGDIDSGGAAGGAAAAAAVADDNAGGEEKAKEKTTQSAQPSTGASVSVKPKE